MKAFIFVALVASVAARSLDLQTIHQLNKEKSLLNTPLVTKVDDELLLKEQLKNNLVQQQLDTTVLPIQDKTLGGIYNVDNVIVDDVDRVLSFQELYNTELFKEYLTLPLVRQYIQYPSFQRFVGSVYFQRFYQLPAYKQYFVNPVLFYKYVYPIVQLFNTEYTLPTEYGQQEDVLGLQTLVDNVLLKNKNFLPYAYNYNNRFAAPTTSFQGQSTNYKFLLEKLYKTLYANQPITQIKTDVKLIPQQKVVVEPINHQQVLVDDSKIVDVQVDSKILPVVDTIVPVTDRQLVQESVVLTEQDVLLLKQLLQKQIITPEIYQAVVLGKINYITILRQVIARGVSTDLLTQIIARLQVVDTVVPVTTDITNVVLNEKHLVILRDLLQKQIISQEVYQSVLVGKIDFVTVLRQVLERRGLTTDLISLIINRLITIDTTVVPVITEQDVLLLKELLRQNIITPQVYQFVVVGKFDFFTLLHQIIVRRDVIDTIVPVVDTTVVLTEKYLVILRDLLQKDIISQDIYQSVLVGKIDFVTVLRQVLERRGLTNELITLIINRLITLDYTTVPFITEQQSVYLVKELLRQNIITPQVYQLVLSGKFDFFTLLHQIIVRRDVIDTIVPVVDNTVVLTEKYLVILRDLFQKQIISQDVYQAVLVGKIDFVTVLRQVLERRGLTNELITLIINRLITLDTTTVPFVTEQQSVYLVKELLRQNIITPQVYQLVLSGKVDFFTLLQQIIVRRDVIDTIYPEVDSTFVLTEKYIEFLKDLYRQQIISQDIYQAVLVGKVDFITVLRQVLERRGLTTELISLIINRLAVVDSVVPFTTEKDVYLLKQLYRQNFITYEIYQSVVYGKIDFFTVLRQIIFRDQVVDTVLPYTNVVNRFSGNQRYTELINKLFGNKNLYNTEIPSIRENYYNYNNYNQRFPIVA